MVKLLIATNNPGKLREYQEILAGLPVELVSPMDAGLTLDPEETGRTFGENAIIKAQAFAQASGLLTLADDSGLEIDALNGEPGVYSARYGNTAKDDHQGRYRLVLEKLTNIPAEKRTARFKCVVALATGERLVGTADGAVDGVITFAPKGKGGFGYDPIFFVPEFDRTLAELTSEEKNSISHRSRAARAAIPMIEQLCDQVAKMPYPAINIAEKFKQFSEQWSPKIIAQLNDYHFKVAKIQGDFVWHSHPETDEVFMVIDGEMVIYFRDGQVTLKTGEMSVVPKGVEHKPFAREECKILLVEPAGTVNTGDAGGELTAENNVWI